MSISTAIDPILVSVIARRLKAVGEQMGVTLEYSAHSPLLVEGRDFSLGIYDADGLLLEQTEYIPVLGYATPSAVRYVVGYFGDDIAQGDIIMHNDPYTGGNQLSDVKVMKPVFFAGRLVAWAVVNAHQADVGGAVAGNYNPNAREIWQEALRITPVKVYEKGKIRKDVWDMIFGNVRLPIVQADIQAAIGGCTVGERELIKLISKYGYDVFKAHVDYLLDTTERMVREEIKAIQDGVYFAERNVYDDGIDHDAVMQIKLKVTVSGDEMIFDFTGTDPQRPAYINAPLAVTVSSVMIGFFMMANPDLPHNDAVLRRLNIIAPEGCLLNPRFPAASGFGNHLSDQIVSVVMMALAEALPLKVTAGWNPLLGGIIAGVSPKTGRTQVDVLINACKGGSGGTFEADGFDHIGLIASGGAIAAQDPEMFEIQDPVFLEKFEYARDSAGAGQWRGGLGVETRFRFEDTCLVSVFGDGLVEEAAAPGLLGGKPGALNSITLTYPSGNEYRTKAKELIESVPKGTIWHQIAGGGGGYGNPYARPADTVASEVRYGLISPEVAERDYGVVMQEDLKAFDPERTSRLRSK